jgi:hypothetical protein
MIQIANPIYDEAFKYLMADNKSATILLSALLGEDIQLISLLPQERSIHTSAVIPQLSVIRFDYIAMVEIHGKQKKVLIELQKSKSHLDIGRFRRYLGNNYTQEEKIAQAPEALPIIAIYIFGFNMEGVEPAVSRFAVQGHDLIECKPFTPEADKFLELLTHVSYFVQLPKLPPKHQTKVGHILSVFSQHWIHDQDSKRLVLPDELKSDPTLGALVSRLESAFADETTRKMLVEEEAFDRTLLTNLDLAKAEGKAEGLVEGMEKGKQAGLVEGMEKGKMETKLEIARNMLTLVSDDVVIAAATGLTVEQVRALRV